MNVSIIIPNYNGVKLLQKNLPSVFSAAEYYSLQTKKEVEIIIVDDASTDASTPILLDFIPSVAEQSSTFQFIQNEKNLGFSSTVNNGVKHAKGDIVILLNTDVSPAKDFIFPLINHFTDKKIFAVGAMDKSIENDKVVLRGRGIGKWERGFLIHKAGTLDKQNSLWASGGSSAFRKSLWTLLGGLDELFNPFYWEDIDLSYRALKSGYHVLFEEKSIVIHEHEKGAIKTKYTKSEVEKIAYRNQFVFVWKNADSSMLVSHILWLPYHGMKAMLRFDLNFLHAFFVALLLLPKIISLRKKNRKHFIYSDDVIIADYTK